MPSFGQGRPRAWRPPALWVCAGVLLASPAGCAKPARPVLNGLSGHDGRVGESICGESPDMGLVAVWSYETPRGPRYIGDGPLQPIRSGDVEMEEVFTYAVPFSQELQIAAALGLQPPSENDYLPLMVFWRAAIPKLQTCSARYLRPGEDVVFFGPVLWRSDVPHEVTIYVLPIPVGVVQSGQYQGHPWQDIRQWVLR